MSPTTWALGSKLSEKRDKGSRGMKRNKGGQRGRRRRQQKLKKREEEEKGQLSKGLFNHEIRLNDEKWGGNRNMSWRRLDKEIT